MPNEHIWYIHPLNISLPNICATGKRRLAGRRAPETPVPMGFSAILGPCESGISPNPPGKQWSPRIIVPSRPMGTCSEGSSPLLYGQLTILSPYLRSRHSFMRHSSIRQFNCQGCAATQFNCQGHARAQLNCQVHPGTQFSLVPFSYSYSQMFPFPDLFATIRHISISPLATSHSYTFSSVNSPSFPLLLGHHIWPGLHHYSQWHNSTFSTFLSTAFPGHHLSQGYISKVTRITPRSQLFFPCIPISLLLQSF